MSSSCVPLALFTESGTNGSVRKYFHYSNGESFGEFVESERKAGKSPSHAHKHKSTHTLKYTPTHPHCVQQHILFSHRQYSVSLYNHPHTHTHTYRHTHTPNIYHFRTCCIKCRLRRGRVRTLCKRECYYYHHYSNRFPHWPLCRLPGVLLKFQSSRSSCEYTPSVQRPALCEVRGTVE